MRKSLIATTSALALMLAAGAFTAGTAAAQTGSQSSAPAATQAPSTSAPSTQPSAAAAPAQSGAMDKSGSMAVDKPLAPSTNESAATTTVPATNDTMATTTTDGEQAQPEGTYLTAELMDNPAQNAQGEEVADVYGFIFDDSGKITHVILTFGGFLGLGEKDVMVPWDQVKVVQTAEETPEPVIQVAITEDQLDAMPDFKTRAEVEEDREDARQAADNAANQPVGTAPAGTAPATTTTTTTQ